MQPLFKVSLVCLAIFVVIFCLATFFTSDIFLIILLALFATLIISALISFVSVYETEYLATIYAYLFLAFAQAIFHRQSIDQNLYCNVYFYFFMAFGLIFLTVAIIFAHSSLFSSGTSHFKKVKIIGGFLLTNFAGVFLAIEFLPRFLKLLM